MKNKFKDRPAIKNCGGKKCGSAFEWKIIDTVKKIYASCHSNPKK